MYWAIKTQFLEKILCPKAFLLHKLHTFSFDNVRNGNFSNTDSLALSQNYGLKMGNSKIDQVRFHLLQLESRSQAKSRHLFQSLLFVEGILNSEYYCQNLDHQLS